MNYSTLTLSLVGIFFVLNLIVGLWFGRKATTMRDYALADKSYGAGPLTITYLATVIGGGWIFRYPKDIYEDGIGTALVILSSALSLFLRAKFIAPKMKVFQNCLSLGDMVRKLYGDESGVMAGVLSVTFNTMAAGMQVACLGTIFASFLGVNFSVGVVLSALLLGLYTALGGMRAVTSTDIFQFVFMVIALALISVFVVMKAGGLESVFSNLPTAKLDFWGSKRFYYYISMIILEIFFFSEMVNPARLDRLLMARSPYCMKRMLNLSGFYVLGLFSLISFIAFSCIVSYPNMTDPGNIVLYIVSNVLPTSIKGIAVVGIVAVLLSSCDSCMHSAGVSMSHNVLNPILKKRGNEILYAKLSIFFVVLLSIWFAIWGKSFLRLDVYMSVVAPILLSPLLFGIFGIKPEKKAFWISAAAAVITLTICRTADPRFYPILSNMAVVIATTASAITYIVVNIHINGALYYVETDGYSKSTTHEWTPRPERLLDILSNILTYPFHFVKRSKEKLRKYGAPFEIFGAFYTAVIVIPYLFWAQEPTPYSDHILYLRLLAVFLCALLMTSSIWPKVTINYLPAFWYLTLMYCLPFLSTIVLLLTNGTIESILSLSINIMFLLLLVDTTTALSLGITGTLLATALYKYGFAPHDLAQEHFSFSTKYILIYQVTLSSAVGLIFSGKKESLIRRLRSLAGNLKGQLILQRSEVKTALGLDERIQQSLGRTEIDLLPKLERAEKLFIKLMNTTPDQPKELADEYNDALATLKYIENVVTNAKNYLKLQVDKVPLDNMLSFLNEVATIYSNNNFSIVTRTTTTEIESDHIMLQNVLFDSIQEVTKNNPSRHNLLIEVSDTKLKTKLQSLPGYEKILDAYRFTITTTGYIENLNLQSEYEVEYTNPKDILPLDQKVDTNEILEEVMDQRIISAHYGVSQTVENGDEYTHIYVVPKNLREIRHLPLDLDLPKEVVITWPGALDLENELKQHIKQKAHKIDLQKIDKALDIIKKYHAHQTRKSGEPYYLHPVHVALIELEWTQEEDAILGALMHDLLEDTAFTIFDIKAAFGDRVAEIVFGVSKLDHDLKTFHNNDEHLMTLDKLNDFTVLSIKISDRIHNMRTISGHRSEAKRRAIATETLKFFVPLAKRLGLERAAEELEGLVGGVLGY